MSNWIKGRMTIRNLGPPSGLHRTIIRFNQIRVILNWHCGLQDYIQLETITAIRSLLSWIRGCAHFRCHSGDCKGRCNRLGSNVKIVRDYLHHYWVLIELWGWGRKSVETVCCIVLMFSSIWEQEYQFCRMNRRK